jgi:hypothetical protein
MRVPQRSHSYSFPFESTTMLEVQIQLVSEQKWAPEELGVGADMISGISGVLYMY